MQQQDPLSHSRATSRSVIRTDPKPLARREGMGSTVSAPWSTRIHCQALREVPKPLLSSLRVRECTQFPS